MAKHCLFYAVQYLDHSAHRDFNDGWYTGARGVFRDTPEGAMARYEKEASEAPEQFSVRLIECRVLEQKNGGSQVAGAAK